MTSDAAPDPTERIDRTDPADVGSIALATSARTAESGGRRRPDRHLGRRRLARTPRLLVVAVVLVLALVGAACGDSGDQGGATGATATDGRFPEGTTVRLLAHDSFAVSEDVLAAFTEQTGVDVELVLAGDAVTMVNQAVLTAGNPQGDVLFGIDDNLLPRAEEAELFEPYQAEGIDAVPASFTEGTDGLVTPIDYGDVCLNYDRAWFAEQGLPVPTTLDQLADPAYRDLLVVQDPTSSSPGLAFLLATIAEAGGGDATGDDAAWLQLWQRLRDNGVRVADSWETAYYTDFSGSSGDGPRPLVVSYASSPPVEVTDPSIPAEQAPTGAIPTTCYRQVEHAGVLRGAAQPEAARALVDFMLSVPFQEDVPGQMYVFPVNPAATLPPEWEKYVEPVTDPLQLPGDEVAANQQRWLDQWATVFR